MGLVRNELQLVDLPTGVCPGPGAGAVGMLVGAVAVLDALRHWPPRGALCAGSVRSRLAAVLAQLS